MASAVGEQAVREPDPETVIETVIDLPTRLPPVMGVGPFLKATVCVIQDDKAYLSRDVGNLDSPENIEAFEATIERVLAETGAKPRVIAHDLHPDFYSTRYAEGSRTPALAVQHHHAHVAAIAAEFGHTAPILGLALDGFGLGPDNESWGGELLWAHGAEYRRLGHLDRLAQPGGDVAAREPWRMAAAALHKLGRAAEIPERFAAFAHAKMLVQLLDKGLNSPETSSCGRLFDAACGLVGVHPIADFEGQAPMALERLVTEPDVLDGGWELNAAGILSLLPTLESLLDCSPEVAANRFHGTLTMALADWATAAAEKEGISTIALCGGCFFNGVLKRGLSAELTARGLTPLAPERVSPGDPAISLGQAWVAAHLDPA